MVNLVVGVDGQPSSLRALEWAALAVGDDGTLSAVTATTPPPHLPPDHIEPTGEVEQRRLLAKTLDDVWCAPIHGRVEHLTTEAVVGDAVEVLTAAAASVGATAIVVGEHHSATTRHRRVGRTIGRLLDRLEIPLIVVPSSVDLDLASGGSVVAGVGHGDATNAAVTWAATWADERGAALGLVRATADAPVLGIEGLLDVVSYYIDPAQRTEWIHDDLASLAAAAQAGSENELDIAMATPRRRPGAALVESSASSSLLVIGHHGAGRRAARVARPLKHALTHAVCPVAVVPPTWRPPR